jgi:hypothetical protein
LLHAPQANSIFARIPRSAIEPLQQWSFFWAWDDENDVVRWMTSFATTEEDVERFAEGLRATETQRVTTAERPNPHRADRPSGSKQSAPFRRTEQRARAGGVSLPL